MRGLFVTGTDTGAGKSVVAAAICAAVRARGEAVAAFKPVVTGLDEPAAGWPCDDELLAEAAGGHQSREQVAPYRFGPPVSPHYAAELAGAAIEPVRLVEAARAAAADGSVLVAEGVGGLLVPITPGYLVRDLAIDLELPVVIAARTGLGTINHSLLTVEAARSAGLRVAGIVMSPWPAAPEPIEVSNRATVQRLAGVAVSGLAPTTPGSLAEVGADLPLDEWLV
jgi:dethiobiotin synthetase